MRRHVEAALRQAEEAVTNRDRFMHVAAHELRTPIASQYGTAQVGRRKVARGQADVATIDNNSSRLRAQPSGSPDSWAFCLTPHGFTLGGSNWT